MRRRLPLALAFVLSACDGAGSDAGAEQGHDALPMNPNPLVTMEPMDWTTSTKTAVPRVRLIYGSVPVRDGLGEAMVGKTSLVTWPEGTLVPTTVRSGETPESLQYSESAYSIEVTPVTPLEDRWYLLRVSEGVDPRLVAARVHVFEDGSVGVRFRPGSDVVPVSMRLCQKTPEATTQVLTLRMSEPFSFDGASEDSVSFRYQDGSAAPCPTKGLASGTTAIETTCTTVDATRAIGAHFTKPLLSAAGVKVTVSDFFVTFASPTACAERFRP